MLTDIPGWDFDGLRKNAFDKWNEELGRIEVEGGTEEQKTTFYTALYHSYLAPYLYSDVDGRYRGHDLEVHKSDHDMYTVFSLWDTFRALHPLFTITQQERTNDLIKVMLDIYEKGGLLPVWELAANETWCMIGYHSIPVITDAYIKGIRGFDAEYAFEAMKKSSMQDREGLEYYRRYGYIPAGLDGASVSKTLEYAYDDWTIARMAEAMGREETATRFYRRADSWRNLFDPVTGFLRARNADGSFPSGFDPMATHGQGFIEGNAWTYSLYVPQDVPALVDLMGGPEAFGTRLDSLFTMELGDEHIAHTEDITRDGIIGNYVHGNEPGHHVAYLYNWTDRPWRTQQRVRMIMDTMYGPGPAGLCGNDDAGQMSAWYIFSALGFYPVCPGSPRYEIGSPLFTKVGCTFST